MYRSILVLLDGSAFAEQALPLACEVARRADATLRLVHVHDPYTQDSLVREAVPATDEPMRPLSPAHARAYLERTCERLAAEADLRIDIALLDSPQGSAAVAQTLADHIAMTDADLVVMTTHGRGGLARFWLGSVADNLVRRSTVPMVLLRPHEAAPERDRPPALRQILIPLDGSALAEAVLEHTLAFGQLMQARYTLFHAVNPFVLTPPQIAIEDGAIPEDPIEFVHRRCEAAERYLSGMAQRLQADGLAVDTRIAVTPHPAVAILDDAREHTCDVIAMSTHGRSGLGRLLIGSVADKVLRGAETPLLLYRPRELGEHR